MKNILVFVSFLFASEICFSQTVKQVETVKIDPSQDTGLDDYDEPAQYTGGRQAMNLFLAQNMRYPQSMLDAGIDGKIYLKFIVEVDGSISSVNVIKPKDTDNEIAAEATRVVKIMPKWIPAKRNGQAVRSWFQLPININFD